VNVVHWIIDQILQQAAFGVPAWLLGKAVGALRKRHGGRGPRRPRRGPRSASKHESRVEKAIRPAFVDRGTSHEDQGPPGLGPWEPVMRAPASLRAG
jgi:hypothetical protein